MGYEEEVSREWRTSKRSKPPSPGVAAPSAGVKRRRGAREGRGALLRRLTRSRRAQLDGDEVVPQARPCGTATAGAPAGLRVARRSGTRPAPRAGVRAPESQHPCADGEHDRLDRVAELAPGWRDGTHLGVQRECPSRRVRPQAPRPAPGGARPPRTVPAGRPSRRAITRCPAPPAAKRSASPITPDPSRRGGPTTPATARVWSRPSRSVRGVA